MKHLKSYENTTKSKPKFKIGDKIYCIDNNGHYPKELLQKDTEYTISDIITNQPYTGILIKLKELEPHLFLNYWAANRFISGQEYLTNKYNL